MQTGRSTPARPEIACALLVLFFIVRKSCSLQGTDHVFVNPANLLDWTLFALSVAYFAIRMNKPTGALGCRRDGWVAADEQFLGRPHIGAGGGVLRRLGAPAPAFEGVAAGRDPMLDISWCDRCRLGRLFY